MIKANWVNGHAIPVEDVNWLEWYDSLEPLVFEPGEEEAIEGMRRAIREKSSAGKETQKEIQWMQALRRKQVVAGAAGKETGLNRWRSPRC